ncbi:MAG: hypothetical protein HOY71_17595, partial [Nonomuraea sp.]|nr:hypothetical protein [Nonomuraea sp.]
MDGPRRAIVVNVVVPLAAYYGLRALGAGQWLALAIGALPPLLWTGYTVVVRRRADALALFALSI